MRHPQACTSLSSWPNLAESQWDLPLDGEGKEVEVGIGLLQGSSCSLFLVMGERVVQRRGVVVAVGLLYCCNNDEAQEVVWHQLSFHEL